MFSIQCSLGCLSNKHLLAKNLKRKPKIGADNKSGLLAFCVYTVTNDFAILFLLSEVT